MLGSSTAMKASPSRARSEANRVPTSLSSIEAQPENLAAVGGTFGDLLASAGDRLRSARRAGLPIAKGSEGWLSTGATITSSTIIPRAKPPLKHMPTAPDARTADRFVKVGREVREAKRMIGEVCCNRPYRELRVRRRPCARDANPYGDRHGAAGRAHEGRHHDREAGVDQVVGKVGHLGSDARDLVDDDHAWARTVAKHDPSTSIGGELAPCPTVEHDVHTPSRMATSARSASDSVASLKAARSTPMSSPIAPCRYRA